VEESRLHEVKLYWIPVLSLLLALLAVLVVFFNVPGDPLDRLKIVVGYVILILIFFFGLIVLINMATGAIDLTQLLAEGDGGASLSRFQLLIFTFVISLSLFMIIVAAKPPAFPAIPTEILTLLGISASTYAVSKGIQASNPEATKKKVPPTQTTSTTQTTGSTPTPAPTPTPPPAHTTTTTTTSE
jgi:hypothetical protein